MTTRRLVLMLALFIFIPRAADAASGTIDSSYKYAWGNQLGWINFAPTNGNVQVTDSALTGYIWSATHGWINLAPTNGGVLQDGSGVLSGNAWGEKTGWINFSGVTISTSTGKFSGTATGDTAGTITFGCTNCDVRTTWRPASSNPAGAVVFVSGGGGSGAGPTSTTTPSATSTAAPSPGPATASPLSPTQIEEILNIPLQRGMHNDDVARLQKLLAQDTEVYPEGLVTGYFGELTERAVQRFQEKYGIVSSGIPETTGYGIVDSKTREKLAEVFGNKTSTEQPETRSSVPSRLVETVKTKIQGVLQQISRLFHRLFRAFKRR